MAQIPGLIKLGRKNTHADRKAKSLDINRKDLNGRCVSMGRREVEAVDEKERGYLSQSTAVLFANRKI
jgi:hypothetical protein